MQETPTSFTDKGILEYDQANTNNHDYSDKIILNNALDVEKGSSDINSALKYFNSITQYMMQLRSALGELRDDIEWVKNVC